MVSNISSRDRLLIPPIIETENCEYQFYLHGGCTVDYVGPFRPGPTEGMIPIHEILDTLKNIVV